MTDNQTSNDGGDDGFNDALILVLSGEGSFCYDVELLAVIHDTNIGG